MSQNPVGDAGDFESLVNKARHDMESPSSSSGAESMEAAAESFDVALDAAAQDAEDMLRANDEGMGQAIDSSASVVVDVIEPPIPTGAAAYSTPEPEVVERGSGPTYASPVIEAASPAQRETGWGRGCTIAAIITLVILCCCLLATLVFFWLAGDVLVEIFRGIFEAFGIYI